MPSHMLLRVYAEEPAEFDRWLESQRADAVEDRSVFKGRRVFADYACMNCHTIVSSRLVIWSRSPEAIGCSLANLKARSRSRTGTP